MSKNKGVKFLDDNLAYLENHNVVVAFGEPVAEKPSSPKPIEEGGTTATMAFWGTDNDFPQQVIERAEKDPELPPLLEWKARVLQGQEVIALEEVWNETKKDFDLQRINDPELVKFLNSRMFKRYWREACVDFTWFQNVFPDMIKSVGGESKIAYIGTHDASYCRWAVMDEKGNVNQCYVSAQWKDGAKPDQADKVNTHTAVDPYDPDLVENLKADTATQRFVYNINYPSPGKAYYPNSAWTSFLFSAWFDIKGKIPQWKLKYMTQVLSASYILTIPNNYWRVANKDWDALTPAAQQEIKKAKVKEINDQLTGQEGVGKTILSEVGVDENGKPVPMFVVEKIQSGLTDGQYSEDSQEVSQYLNRALNVDSTLVGNGPGRGKDAGSGSDKRVAFNIYCAILQPHREVILEPVYFMLEYNGYLDQYPTLKLKVKEVELQTLDQGSTSVEKNPVTPQPPAE